MPEVSYKFREVEGFRAGELRVNGRKIQTPVFWLGYLFNGIRPWEHITGEDNEFEIDSILVNAYEILQKKKVREGVRNRGLRKYLDYSGNVLMDSGGFLFQKKAKMAADPGKISDLYGELQPDMGVVLDHPFSPKEEKEVNRKRWEKTLENTEKMVGRNGGEGATLLMPVLHGYSEEELNKAFDELEEIVTPEVIGLGSMVPLLQWHKYTEVINLVTMVRKRFPETFLHVFGVGGTTSMYFLYSLGVDSIDSIAWRLKAAFGAVQLPGVGDRFVVSKNRKRGRIPLEESEEDMALLEKCCCPICRGREMEERMIALDNTRKKTFENRALHNAWTYRFENEEIKKKIREGRPAGFTKERLSNSPYGKLQETIQQAAIGSFFA